MHISRKINNLFFKYICLFSMLLCCSIVIILVSSLAYKGWGGFFQTYISVEDQSNADQWNKRHAIETLKESVGIGGAKISRKEIKSIKGLINSRIHLEQDGEKVLLLGSYKTDQFAKGKWSNLDKRQEKWLAHLKDNNALVTKWNWNFFVNPDSREPELAGIGSAIVSSVMILVVMIAIVVPVGLFSAISLEEFRNNKFVSVVINNLAAVPSIIFGMLGVVLGIELLGIPRSSSFLGGCVLAMMILPTFIIACRSAISSVPEYLKRAGLALGASKMQVVFHHTIPYSMSGLLTAFILSVSQALGQTAPLLVIGMMSFSSTIPGSFLEPATGLPVQIYLWSESPERAFVEKAAAAVLCLLILLVLINIVVLIFRNYFEKKYPINTD